MEKKMKTEMETIRERNIKVELSDEVGMFLEPTLLNHLLCWGYDPEDYLDMLDNIETAIKEKEYLVEHPEEANEEAQYLDDDIESWQEELKDMRAEWKPKKEPNMEEELELITKWVKERDEFING